MKKLEINHIAPYLPYGMKCQIIETGNFRKLLSVNANESVLLSADEYNPFSYTRYKPITGIKPLLRPLSDLYKEIDGKYGIVELFKMLCTEDDPYESFHIRLMVDCLEIRDNEALFYFQDGAFRYIVKDELDGFIPNQLDLFTYLFENHYDIFNLIGQNLAIDLNSISHE